VSELLLELLCEEIPARMQHRAIADLTGLLRDKLAAAEIPGTSLRGYVTPRRLAIIADGIPGVQPNRTEERRGPRVGAPQPAIDGFLRSAGLTALEQLEIRDTDRGEFYFAALHHPGRPAAQMLPEVIRAAMAELPWPKSMRYPASSLRWVRPLVSILCLFDGEVLLLPLDRVPVGRTTRGHRFLSRGEICVGNAADYIKRLGEANVVLDRDCRKEMIRRGLENAVAAEGLSLKPDPELLDEVTGLVEFPVVLAGAIDAEFMTLPPEVLATAMRTHQKYFSCVQADSTPAPRFVFVANNLAPDGGKTIIAGNERVLRARLADARFFWDQDRKIPLAVRVDALKTRVLHAKLGDLFFKAERMVVLAEFLSPYVRSESERTRRAAWLAKADLSTGMVGEFPELQGVMGRYYALNDGEEPNVAYAIAEHYKPLGPNDACPTNPDSVAVALADKIDSLVGFFGINQKPSGSRDPFGLRRAALGVIRLILENQLRLPLTAAFRSTFEYLDRTLRSRLGLINYAELGLRDPTSELLDFIAERLKVHLREHNFRHDVIAAVFAPATGGLVEDDLFRLTNRAYYLREFLASDDGVNLLTAFRRASNIVAIEERRDGCIYSGEVDERLLREPEEQALAARLAQVNSDPRMRLDFEDFRGAMSVLASLRQPVDEFFEKVTVNTDEASLRENRLHLLSRIRATMNRVADFSQIEG
jgi:glycyl-tRNA synthetase beta chain